MREFLSEPTLSSDFAYVNESKDIVIRVAIAIDADIDVNISKVELYQNDQQIGILQDNGDVSNGDDIANDGVYSIKLNVLKDKEEELYHTIKVNNKYISSIAILSVIKKITDEEIDKAQDITANALNLLPKNTKMNDAELSSNLDKIINSIKSDSDVADVNVSKDKTLITFTTKSGYTSGIIFSFKNNDINEITKKISRVHNNGAYTKYNNPLYKTQKAKSYNKLTLKSLNTKSTGLNNTIGSQKILILDPMKFDFGEYSPKSIFLGNSTFSNKVTYYDNYNVTIERFKNLNKYGIIIISTHSNKDGVILTGQQATKNLIKQYSADIKKKRLFTYKHEVLVKDGGFWFWEPDDTEEKVDVFILNPSFIKYYNKNLPNSLVYLGMCSGMETGNPLPQILIKIGAKAVVGYNNTVNASYDNSIVSTFFTTMLDKKTLKESLNEAKKQHGVNDEANGKKDNPPTPAEPIFAGDGTLKLFKEGIENGSFEDNLKFWTNEGDARVLSKLGSLKPQNGVLMSIISTGLGSNNDATSSIQQSFVVPNSAQKINFSYDVISEEPTEYVGSEYDDKFEVHIIDENGNDSIVTQESINTSAWYSIEGINFDGGDDTIYHTKWKSDSIDISQYQGQNITIKFVVYDKGDSAYDTAVLLDNIKLQ